MNPHAEKAQAEANRVDGDQQKAAAFALVAISEDIGFLVGAVAELNRRLTEIVGLLAKKDE